MGGLWFVGDTSSTTLFYVNDAVRTENTSALDATIESADLKQFPIRAAIPAAFMDFTKSASNSVTVSWSHDGGETYNTPRARAMSGSGKQAVKVRRLGVATHHGLRLRMVVSGPDDWAFLGASVPDPEPRAP